MKIKPILRQFFLLLGFCLFTIQIFGQVDDVEKFAAIPSPMRERLIERFNLFIEYDRSKQYEELYDLFTEDFIRPPEFPSINKSDYVKNSLDRETKKPQRRLIEFKISSVESFSDFKSVRIHGMAKYKVDKEITRREYEARALYQNGDWYFFPWMLSTSEGSFMSLNSQIAMLFTALEKEPTARGIITVNGKKKEIAERETEIRKFIRLGKYNIKRIKFVRENRDDGDRTRFDVVSAGEKTPSPQP